MNTQENITLCRDCDAILIPQGTPIILMKGTEVVLTQALGGSYTLYSNGHLLRINAEDVDALGENFLKKSGTAEKVVETAAVDSNSTLEEKIWAQLRTCYDPEIPVNIADLGLIYRVVTSPSSIAGFDVAITMTLTAPGCGMGPVLVTDVKQKVSVLPEVGYVEVELVFDPPWTQDRMTEAAKLQLGVL